MSSTNRDDPNPYQSPAVDVLTSESAASELGSLSKVIAVFHSQIQILGFFWICCSIVCFLLCISAAQLLDIHINGRPQYNTQSLLFGVAGVLWLLSGLMAYCKQIWAVYLGLMLTYLFFIANLLMLQMVVAACLLFAILLSHRILRWAGQLSKAGIPLTMRPNKSKFPLPD
jgi:hypothetical protein